MKREEIIMLIKKELSMVLDQQPDDIDEDENFLRIGISSIKTLKIINRISRILDIDVNPVAMFEYTTISQFTGYLSDCVAEKEEA